MEKERKLENFFKTHPKAALAFSGGIDSTFLLYSAKKAGADVRAYYMHSAFQPEETIEEVRKIASRLDANLVVIPLDILTEKHIAMNPPNRCYYCKKALFQEMQRHACLEGYSLLLDGTNASDAQKDRPGMQALHELGIVSPLRELGLTKSEIREASRQAGLPEWKKPSDSCLATRILSGEPITASKLDLVCHGEKLLRELGFKNFRLRLMPDGTGLIEVPESQLADVLAKRTQITVALSDRFRAIHLNLKERNDD